MNYEELKSLALESGFTHTAPLDTATIELKQDVRDMCASMPGAGAVLLDVEPWISFAEVFIVIKREFLYRLSQN